MRKNRPVAILAALLLAMLLAGCSGGGLPEGFVEAEVKAAAEEVVLRMNDEDFEGITGDMVREDLKEALSPEVLANAYSLLLADAGAFKAFGSQQFTGGETDEGEAFATAVLVADYEHRKVVYTLSYDKHMEIIGFYMK